MIHVSNNLISDFYKPSYIYGNRITTSTQTLDQDCISNTVVEPENNGINSIIDEINNGQRLSNINIPIIYASYSPLVYDFPQSVFSASELLDPEEFQDIVTNPIVYLLT